MEGVDYHFTHAEDFLHSIACGEFVEWAEVYKNYYGTSKHRIEELQGKGKSVILDIDVQGAVQLQKLPDFEATYLFISPPSLEELRNRLVGRGTETEASLNTRINNAEHELTFQDRYDQVVLNDDLDHATQVFLMLLIEQSVDPEALRSQSIQSLTEGLMIDPEDTLALEALNDLKKKLA